MATGSRLQAAVERTSSDGAAAANRDSEHGGGGGVVGGNECENLRLKLPDGGKVQDVQSAVVELSQSS